MSNSKLATVQKISPNRTIPRNSKIDTVTIHCFCGQVTAAQGVNSSRFTTYNRKTGCSCNYVVGKDGSIGLCVPESDRSWCSSSSSNDHRAITIEVASDAKPPYKVTDKAYNALIELLHDICARNNIKKLVWSPYKTHRIYHTNGANMTLHRDFANKACPGEYLYNLHPKIAEDVNAKLNCYPYGDTVTPYKVRVTRENVFLRKGPGLSYDRAGVVAKGVYTIVAHGYGQGASLWGRLKSGAGWISLDCVTKVKG